MGQCVTMDVGNKHETTTREMRGDESTPRGKRRKKRKRDKHAEEESEDDGEDGLCGCIEDITGCLPCI